MDRMDLVFVVRRLETTWDSNVEETRRSRRCCNSPSDLRLWLHSCGNSGRPAGAVGEFQICQSGRRASNQAHGVRFVEGSTIAEPCINQISRSF